MDSRILLLVTLAGYAVGVLHVVLHMLTNRRRLAQGAATATLAGFAVHTAALSQRWTESGRFPLGGLHDSASLLAWVTVLAFLVAYLRTRVDALGLIVYPVAFVLVLVAAFSPAGTNEMGNVSGALLGVHVTLAFIGYAALFVAFAMGVLYLIQERELKSRAPRAYYYMIPSLERCDTISGRSVAVGFGFLTLAIVTGALLNQAAFGRWWLPDPKTLSALAAWGLYVVLITARRRAGWGGRRAAWLGLVGFALVVGVFFYVSVLGGAPQAGVAPR